MAHVAVALSGGVDSAVAAALLKRQGHTVTAVHMKTGFYSGAGKGAAHLHAARLAERLEISFHLLDVSTAFRKRVVDYFVNSYLQGRTPNPCVVCNPEIKFGRVLQEVKEMGADFLGTGHYVIKEFDEQSSRYVLRKGVDPGKDQSYFLHRMHQPQLEAALFPLGKFHKTEIRNMARDMGLNELVASESQEFCFMGEENYKQFLDETGRVQQNRGELVDVRGKVLGYHSGIHRYTIGQRRGLNLPSSEPYYVVKIDPVHNRVVVGRKNNLFCSEMVVEDVNWMIEPPLKPVHVFTRIRFRHKEASSTVEPINHTTVRVVFNKPVPAVTPGQAAVFYSGDLMLGGGWIQTRGRED